MHVLPMVSSDSTRFVESCTVAPVQWQSLKNGYDLSRDHSQLKVEPNSVLAMISGV